MMRVQAQGSFGQVLAVWPTTWHWQHFRLVTSVPCGRGARCPTREPSSASSWPLRARGGCRERHPWDTPSACSSSSRGARGRYGRTAGGPCHSPRSLRAREGEEVGSLDRGPSHLRPAIHRNENLVELVRVTVGTTPTVVLLKPESQRPHPGAEVLVLSGRHLDGDPVDPAEVARILHVRRHPPNPSAGSTRVSPAERSDSLVLALLRSSWAARAALSPQRVQPSPTSQGSPCSWPKAARCFLAASTSARFADSLASMRSPSSRMRSK